jgi:hypothetical protein
LTGLRLFPAALLLFLAATARAEDCAHISRHFELCDAGTDWAAGEWEHFGDGATLHLGPLAFDFFEDWAGRHKGEAPSVDAALDDLVADVDEGDTSVPHLRDSFSTDTLTVARFVETATFGANPPLLRTTMIAEARGQRILLMLNAPAEFSQTEMDRRAREVATIVRAKDAAE